MITTKKTNNNQNIVNEENINKCLEYIEGEEYKTLFKELVKDLDVRVKLIDYGKMNWDDSNEAVEPRNIYRITFKRNGKKVSIRFGQSLVNTREGIEPSLYDVLTMLGSEQSLYLNDNGFEDFCDELGYDYDSRKAEKQYKQLQRQGKKIAQVFEDELIWALPN